MCERHDKFITKIFNKNTWTDYLKVPELHDSTLNSVNIQFLLR